MISGFLEHLSIGFIISERDCPRLAPYLFQSRRTTSLCRSSLVRTKSSWSMPKREDAARYFAEIRSQNSLFDAVRVVEPQWIKIKKEITCISFVIVICSATGIGDAMRSFANQQQLNSETDTEVMEIYLI